MDMDFEKLRKDLVDYITFALSHDLPCAACDTKEAMEADEAQLVALAAEQGWDFGKYVKE